MQQKENEPALERDQSQVEIGDVRGGIHGSIIAGGNVVQNLFRRDPAGSRERRNKLILVDKVEEFWVKGVFESSIHSVLLDITKLDEPDSIEHPWETTVQMVGKGARQTTLDQPIASLFADAHNSLLILGAPGSGKTITLLELAGALCKEARLAIDSQVPVVLNLSSWASRRDELATWVVNEINQKYQIPKKIVRTWVESGDLAILCDGLDEVAPEHQTSCVHAVNRFREEYGLNGIVVCCRAEDYQSLDAKLGVSTAIQLQRLTATQRDAYVDRFGSSSLKTEFSTDHELRELAESPLMLSIICLAYRDGHGNDERKPAATVDERRNQVFEFYVEQMFHRRGKVEQKERDKAERWLHILARRLREHELTVIAIEDLQPSWLVGRWSSWLYILASRLLLCALIGTLTLLGWVLVLHSVDYSKVVKLGVIFLGLSVGLGFAIAAVDIFRSRSRRQGARARPLLSRLSPWIGADLMPYCLFVIVISTLLLIPFASLIESEGLIYLLLAGAVWTLGGLPYGFVFGSRRALPNDKQDIKTSESISFNMRRFVLCAIVGLLLSCATYAVTSATRIPTAKLWAGDGQQIANLESLPLGDEYIVEFSPDGSRLVTVADVFKLMDYETTRREVDEIGFEDVAGMYLWNAKSGQLIAKIDNSYILGRNREISYEHGLAPETIFSSDGSRLIGLTENSEVELLDAEDGRHIAMLGHSMGALFSPNGKEVLVDDTSGRDVRLYDSKSGKHVHTFDSPRVRLWSILRGYNRNGTRILMVGRATSQQVEEDPTRSWWLFSADERELISTWEDKGGARFSPDGSTILEVGEELLWLRNSEDGAVIKAIETLPRDEWSYPLYPITRGRRTMVPTRQGIGVFDIDSGAELCVLDFSSYARQYSPITSPDLSRVVERVRSPDPHFAMRLWDATNGERLAEFSGCTRVNISDDWQTIEVQLDGGIIKLLSAIDGSILSQPKALDDSERGSQIAGDFGRWQDIRFSPDNTRVVTVHTPLDLRNFSIIVLVLGIAFGSTISWSSDVRDSKVKPNQGTWLSLRNSLVVGLIGGCSITVGVLSAVFLVCFVFSSVDDSNLVYDLRENLRTFPIWRLVCIAAALSLLVAICFGASDLLKHFILRAVCAASGVLPWRLVAFLDRSAARVLLRKVGGGYIFTHRLLLDFFADRRVEGK